MKKTIAILFALILVGCTTANKDYTEYKVSFGKKCSKDNTQYSYVWFIDVVGEPSVTKGNCK
jgi:uncharacterized lipoprotein YmbA